jgi:methyl-accepting chemotaxis protein
MEATLLVFTGILAFAVLIQTLLFLGIYKSIRRVSDSMDGWGKDLLRHAEVISSRVEEGLTTIKSTAESIRPITQNLVGATQIVHNRVVELDNFLAEATDTARQEIARIQDTIQLASSKAEEAVEILRDTVLAPVNEINAVIRAIRVSLDVLFRRRRNPSNASAQDEEMFI